jgi:hypothetical protein
MGHLLIFSRARAARRWIAGSLAVATAVAFAAPVAAAPNYTIDGLRVTPPIGEFGGVKVDSCHWETAEGCKFRTFTITNVGSEPVLFGGFGVHSPVSDVGFDPRFPDEESCEWLPLVEVGGQRYKSLAPGEACEVIVAMAPTTVGRVERTLDAFSDDQFSPILIVPLRAVGLES